MSHETVLIKNLTKTFADVVAVDNLHLTIEQGQFVALLGPSGCGKTTTLRMLAGFETPDDGYIEIGGAPVTGPNLFVAPEKRRIGMVFQSYALFPHLTVAQNIAYGLSKKEVQAGRAQEALEMVRLPQMEERMPHELSGGQQQRVALARALAPNPDLILLDEPFSNLDAALRATVRAEVRDILRQAQATALFVTHDQAEALSLADTVAVMINGRLVQIAPPERLYQQPATTEVATFLGEANFLPGTVSDGVPNPMVDCELGRIPTYGSAIGSVVEVNVMIRPEEIQLDLNDNGRATILRREYFGHDQLLTCRLDSGAIIYSRFVGMNNGFVPGKRVDFKLPEQVVVFPAK
jgi:iron(III) transport system ATP-binding protein